MKDFQIQWEVGLKVIIRDNYARRTPSEEPGVVTKIGRKYATVERTGARWANPTQYHLDTGYEKSDYMARRRILTPETAALEARRTAALDGLKALGWAPIGYGRPETSTSTMELMLALLEDDQ